MGHSLLASSVEFSFPPKLASSSAIRANSLFVQTVKFARRTICSKEFTTFLLSGTPTTKQTTTAAMAVDPIASTSKRSESITAGLVALICATSARGRQSPSTPLVTRTQSWATLPKAQRSSRIPRKNRESSGSPRNHLSIISKWRNSQSATTTSQLSWG